MAQIKTGTVALTNGSNEVTGSGTAWLTDGVQAGDGFVLQTSSGVTGSGVYYTVAGVASNTSLTLTANWGGATASGAAYIVHTDFIAAGYPALLPGDLEVKPVMNRNVLKLVNDKADSADLGTAATKDTGTAAGEVPLNSDLGTAASADTSTLLARSNHTGTQPLSTISDSGTAAAKDTGTAAGEVPLNSDLGTAATADLTTSPTDTTADRVLRVGAGYQQLDSTLIRDSDLGTAAAADTSTLLARSNHTGTQTLATISDSGTAAAKDIGTAAGEVPLNSDLGTAATADTDDLSVKQASNVTVTVGTSGDFTTINAALTHLSGLYPEYKNTGVTATVELQAGFVISEQVLVRGIDFGWVTITGVDAETVIDHTDLTIDFTTADYGFASRPAFGVSKGGTLPRIAQLFSMSSGSTTSEGKHGVLAVGAGSGAEIDSGCGVKNAGTNGIYATRGSTINAHGADASNAGSIGIYALHAGTINAHGADASGAGNYGIYALHAGTINAHGADASGAGNYGIFATRGSTINAKTALIQNQTTGTYAIRVLSGSHIEASGINTSGTTVTIFNQSVNTLTGNGIIYQ